MSSGKTEEDPWADLSSSSPSGRDSDLTNLEDWDFPDDEDEDKEEVCTTAEFICHEYMIELLSLLDTGE